MADTAYLEQLAKPALLENDTISFSRQLGELLPITKHRLLGLKAFDKIEIPDRVQHLWRYSRPDTFMPKLPMSQWHVANESRNFPAVPENTIVLDSSGLRAVNLNEEFRNAKVQVEPISTSSVGAGYLGRAVTADFGLFEALNTARWNSSVVITVPANAQISSSLTLVVMSDTPIAMPRILIVAKEQSQIRIIQDHRGGDKDQLTNCVAEVIAEQGANVEHILIQRLEKGTTAHFTSRASLSRDAHYKQTVFSLGASKFKADLGAHLHGKGANSEIFGVAFEDKKQQFDHHTVHKHTAEHTWSNIDFKVALTGRSKSAYTGLIRIEEDADFSEAYQESRNLLLSDRCHADSIPELEIMTNEVRCTHGATSAPIDPNEVFYLQSRGLSKNNASKMIVKGFFEKLLAKIPKDLQPEINSLIDGRLEAIEVE